MTGVGSDASKLYALGTSYYGYSVETFSWTGTVGASPYINSFVGLGTGYDIGYSGSYVWVANDAADSPVRAFNTAGTPVNAIPGSIIGNAARGVDFESATLMWVSNPNNDKIYKIDLSVGVGEGQGAEVPAGLAAGPNPFTASVTIEGGGFGRGAVVTIFDMQGRSVMEEAFPGVFVWDASGVPPGPYFARVTDGASSQTLRLIRI